jgi:hypothetical protein
MKLRGLVETVREKYETLRDVLSERQRRIWAATEARALPSGPKTKLELLAHPPKCGIFGSSRRKVVSGAV